MTQLATSTLTAISTRFAAQLAELTHAIARGDNVDHRLEVLREYARTWLVVAENGERVVRRT